jgi:hypothetical protein
MENSNNNNDSVNINQNAATPSENIHKRSKTSLDLRFSDKRGNCSKAEM